MTATLSERDRRDVEKMSAKWWVLLITGILWIVISVLVLDADLDSALAIGYLVGGFLIASGVMEFLSVGLAEGWKWLHAVLGALFVLGGVAAFFEPLQTFGILASLLGFFFVLKGVFDFILSLAEKELTNLWWVRMVSGILTVGLGFWCAGYPGRSAGLLLLWVGFGALARGVLQLVLAFQVRKVHEAVT